MAVFFVLAAAVIVPYQAIVLAATGTGPFARASLGAGVSYLLLLLEAALITPLVSALHVHAVAEVQAGGQPRLASIARQGLKVLPVVAAASIMSWLGILLGSLLIVPGIILFLRWAVVAQFAAIDHQGWQPALSRSRELTKWHYWHVSAVILSTFVIGSPSLVLSLSFRDHSTTAVLFVAGVALQVLIQSFTALILALLYFDLRVRFASAVSGAAGAHEAPPGDRLDPKHAADGLGRRRVIHGSIRMVAEGGQVASDRLDRGRQLLVHAVMVGARLDAPVAVATGAQTGAQ